MNFKNSIVDGQIKVFVATSVFSKEAVLKAIYWYGDKFHTNISFADESILEIVLYPLSHIVIQESELELYLQKLERDIVDFQLRDDINKETQNVRELLIAKAFSNGEYDEIAPGEIADPVGFSVELATANEKNT